ncbi:hypothetical protein ACFL27_07640 [candidate division CSSED10-310 bacterium]|uniref:ABC-type transport auxiliary lipoprotein component domain-containing protein n=1 Tax=candidate division CSSED10-310 bacterium TaxID=2855610 RepID=A0ABV6YV09_UNCC1
MRKMNKQRTLVILLGFVFMIGCSVKKKENEFQKEERSMRHGDLVDLYWIDPDTDFSLYSSLQIPNFKDKRLVKKYEWVQELMADEIADRLSELKVFSLIDRTPEVTVPWTDLVLAGEITNIELNMEARCQINIECTLNDVRKKMPICFFKHKKFIYGNNIGTANPLRKIVEKAAMDISIFLKDIRKYQLDAKAGK